MIRMPIEQIPAREEPMPMPALAPAERDGITEGAAGVEVWSADVEWEVAGFSVPVVDAEFVEEVREVKSEVELDVGFDVGFELVGSLLEVVFCFGPCEEVEVEDGELEIEPDNADRIVNRAEKQAPPAVSSRWRTYWVNGVSV